MRHTQDMFRGKRVLVVEDEYLLAVEMQRQLQQNFATVIGPVATVQEALSLIDEHGGIDAAVLDIRLDGETSYQVADALLDDGVPFVFASAEAMENVPARLRDFVMPKSTTMQAVARKLFR